MTVHMMHNRYGYTGGIRLRNPPTLVRNRPHGDVKNNPRVRCAFQTPSGTYRRHALYDASHTHQKRSVDVSAASTSSSKFQPEDKELIAKNNLSKMGQSLRSVGWIGFWTQFSLVVVSAVMTIFSMMFTKPTSLASRFSLYLILLGVACGFFSTYWAFGYIQLSKKIRRSLKDLGAAPKRTAVERNLSIGLFANIVGIGTTLLGLQAVVGFLVAKTLANATANPFLAGGVGSWNPVLALDVFLVQAASNCLLSHFAALCFTMWLQRIMGSK